MSIEKKEDRRIRKTKKALREGLADLMTEKSIQHITVKELTDKADIHRSTFYANFEDIYDLYNQLEDTVMQEISELFMSECNLDAQAFFGILLQYITDNKQVCRLILAGKVNGNFQVRISNFLKDLCVACWKEEYNIVHSIEKLELYAQFFLSGGLGVIGEWVMGNCETSTEEIMLLLADSDYAFGNLIKDKFAYTQQ